MIHIFLTDGALQELFHSDKEVVDCPRGDYLIDDTETPISFEVRAGEDVYCIESWIRDDSAARIMSFGERIEYPYDEEFDPDEEGAEGSQKAFAVVARQLDRFFNDQDFWENNIAPDPEEGGVLLSYAGDEFNTKIVTGDERPDMKCYITEELLIGNTHIDVARPYKDEVLRNVRTKLDLD